MPRSKNESIFNATISPNCILKSLQTQIAPIMQNMAFLPTSLSFFNKQFRNLFVMFPLKFFTGNLESFAYSLSTIWEIGFLMFNKETFCKKNSKIILERNSLGRLPIHKIFLTVARVGNKARSKVKFYYISLFSYEMSVCTIFSICWNKPVEIWVTILTISIVFHSNFLFLVCGIFTAQSIVSKGQSITLTYQDIV